MASDEEQDIDGLKVFPSSYRLATYDVMCGRNKVAEGHRGNKRFRALIEKHCLHYMKEDTSRDERRSIVTHILDQVVDKGGYFLKQEYEDGEFLEISIKYAREKIVHSLRDTCLKLQSTIQEVVPKETPSTKTKHAVANKKNSMNKDEASVSVSTTQTEASDKDSKGEDQQVSEGEETFKSYQSNTSTLEGIDECRIRRKRHRIDCKPRKKPKLPGCNMSIPVRGKEYFTRNQKKQSTPVHRKQGTKITLPMDTNRLSSTNPQKPQTPPDDSVGPSTNSTMRARGIEALAAHRALVLAAMKAEQAGRVLTPEVEIDFQSPRRRIVTPPKGTSFTSPLLPLNNVDCDADSSALDTPLSTFQDIVKAPSSFFDPGILEDISIEQSPGGYQSSPHLKDKKNTSCANHVHIGKRKDNTRSIASVGTSCRSDATPDHQAHALLLEEAEDERISCWGEYC